jgi:hypothetical protein
MTEYRDLGGGLYEPVPGTGIWKSEPVPVSCSTQPDEGDFHVIAFSAAGLNYYVLDGGYQVSLQLTSDWKWPATWRLFASRHVVPDFVRFQPTKPEPWQTANFEIVRRTRIL